MDKTHEQLYLQLEDHYWWFTARRDLVRSMLGRLPRTSRILEVGCSGGHLLEMLIDDGFTEAYGIDISASAISACHARGIHPVEQMDATHLRFDDGTFDMIIASDVLEHIEDDSAAVIEWQRVLRPGGTAIIFVPAFGFMWSEHDELNHHFRRYTRRSLIRLLEPGFRVIRASYWNFLLFLPAAIWRVSRRLLYRRQVAPRGRSQMHEMKRAMNSFLFMILKLENRVLRLVDLPVGVSVFAIVQKSASSTRKEQGGT